MTMWTPLASFTVKHIIVFIKQTGGGSVRAGIYSQAGNLLASTAAWTPTPTGLSTQAIAYGSDGSTPQSSVDVTGSTIYYAGLWGNSSANGAQFTGVDAGLTFGATPFVAIIKDNIGTFPTSVTSSYSESSQRFFMSMTST